MRVIRVRSHVRTRCCLNKKRNNPSVGSVQMLACHPYHRNLAWRSTHGVIGFLRIPSALTTTLIIATLPRLTAQRKLYIIITGLWCDDQHLRQLTIDAQAIACSRSRAVVVADVHLFVVEDVDRDGVVGCRIPIGEGVVLVAAGASLVQVQGACAFCVSWWGWGGRRGVLGGFDTIADAVGGPLAALLLVLRAIITWGLVSQSCTMLASSCYLQSFISRSRLL